MPDYVQAIGRVLMSAVFILFGYIQFTNIGNYIANPAVIKVAAITLIGGLLFLIALGSGRCSLDHRFSKS